LLWVDLLLRLLLRLFRLENRFENRFNHILLLLFLCFLLLGFRKVMLLK